MRSHILVIFKVSQFPSTALIVQCVKKNAVMPQGDLQHLMSLIYPQY